MRRFDPGPRLQILLLPFFKILVFQRIAPVLLWREEVMASAATMRARVGLTARLHLRGIVVLAIAARVFMAAFYFRSHAVTPLAHWGYENVSIALALSAGQGFSSPFGFPSGPTAFMPPGYPLLIAGFMRVLGSGVTATLGLITFQILLSVCTVVLVQKTASRYFSLRTGNFAGLICALAEPFLVAPLYIWDTCLSALILTAAVAAAPDLRHRKDFVPAGITCALAALINPALLFALFGIFGWAAWRARVIPWLGLCAFMIAFSPWPLRNYAVMHAFVPLRSNPGYELWLGNQDGSNAESVLLRDPWQNPKEQRLFLSEGEIGYMREKASIARSWIRAHPSEFAQFTVRRFFRFWIGSSKSPAPMTVPLVAAALIGLVLLWRSRPMFSLFALPLLIFPLPYYITHADIRFQFVLDPLLAILAGYACESFFAWCARRAAPSPTFAAVEN